MKKKSKIDAILTRIQDCLTPEEKPLLLCGTIHIHDSIQQYFSNQTWTTWTNESGETPSKTDLNNLAVCINSPWSQKHETYTISLNCKDAYTDIPEHTPLFQCAYTVIGYDGITSILYGYGASETEALENCMELFEYLQYTYNPEDESF